jgi:hypothetical protein
MHSRCGGREHYPQSQQVVLAFRCLILNVHVCNYSQSSRLLIANRVSCLRPLSVKCGGAECANQLFPSYSPPQTRRTRVGGSLFNISLFYLYMLLFIDFECVLWQPVCLLLAAPRLYAAVLAFSLFGLRFALCRLRAYFCVIHIFIFIVFRVRYDKTTILSSSHHNISYTLHYLMAYQLGPRLSLSLRPVCANVLLAAGSAARAASRVVSFISSLVYKLRPPNRYHPNI